jgi:hypothetical protein
MGALICAAIGEDTSGERQLHTQPATPQRGEWWCLKADPTDKDDPFPGRTYQPIKVLEVKDGWVRYAMDVVFDDERTNLTTFTGLWARCPQQADVPQPAQR